MYLLGFAFEVPEIGPVLFTVVADELRLNVAITFLQGNPEHGFVHVIHHLDHPVEIGNPKAGFDDGQRLALLHFSRTRP